MEYQIIDHGPEHEQYFQGCGVAFTKFDMCFTGIGDNAKDAYEDAAEHACAHICSGPDGMPFSEALKKLDLANQLPMRPRGIRASDRLTREQMENGEIHWYVSIRIKF